MALPQALRKQVLIRTLLGAGFLILFFVILASFRDFYFSIPCLLLSAVLLGNGGWLLVQGIRKNYIRLEGVCDKIETAGIRKRVRSIRILLEQDTLKIPIRQGMKQLAVGDTVIVYLSDRTPVYEQEGGYMICSYFALETGNRKRYHQNESR